MPTMGAKWKQISPRWPELGSDPRTPHDRSPGRRCRPGSQPPLQQPSGRMWCKVMNPKTMTHLQYVTTCHDMSWYVTMSPAFNRPFLWRVGCTAKGSQWCGRRSLQKNWWCKRVMGPPRNPNSGDKLDTILLSSQKYLGTFPSKKYLGTWPQNMRENRSWSSNHLHSILIYYTILLMCNCFWCIPNHSKATAAELYREAL